MPWIVLIAEIALALTVVGGLLTVLTRTARPADPEAGPDVPAAPRRDADPSETPLDSAA